MRAPYRGVLLDPETNRPPARLNVAVWLLLAVSCATRSPPPPAALACAPPCAAIREVKFPATVIVAVFAPSGSRLKNAMLSSSAARGCGSGVPVKLVDVDGQQYSEGPAVLAGTHTLDLRFPFVGGHDANDAGLSRPISLDLDVRTPAGDRCVRLTVEDPGPGWWNAMGELSYRMEPRR